MTFSSLTYSTLLVSLDPDRELQLYSNIPYEIYSISYPIHPWYYINQIIQKFLFRVIDWTELIYTLPGTKTQIIRFIQYIDNYLTTRGVYLNTFPSLFHYKLDYTALKKLIDILSPTAFNDYIPYLKHYDLYKDEKSLCKLLVRFSPTRQTTMDDARKILYKKKCCSSDFKLTSENYMNVLEILHDSPFIAEFPWIVDIHKYIDLNAEPQKHIKMHFYANPKIDQDIFEQFTRSNTYLHIQGEMYKYIQNMFRFRMRKGLGLELYYPQCDNNRRIEEDSVEWRVELYKLNIGLLDAKILLRPSQLIHAIPGRHSQYLDLYHMNIIFDYIYDYDDIDKPLELLLK